MQIAPEPCGHVPSPVPEPTADLAITPGGRYVAVATDTYETPTARGRLDVVDLTDPPHPAQVSSRPVDRHYHSAMALRPDGALVATFDSDLGTLQPTAPVITEPPTVPFVQDSGHGAVPALAFRPDGRVLAMTDYVLAGTDEPTATERGQERLRLWDVADPAHPRLLGPPAYRDLETPQNPQDQRTPAPLFTPDGQNLLSLRSDGVIVVWDVADPAAARPVGRLADAAGRYTALAVSPQGRTVAAVIADTDAGLQTWDITDPAQPARGGQRQLTTSEPVVAFATAGTLLVADGTRLIALPTDLDAQIRRICTEAGATLTEQQWRDHVGTEIDRRPLC